MTINLGPAKEWTKHNGGHDDPRFNSCSPNLTAIRVEMQHQWPAHGEYFGILDLGCYGERDIRGGAVPSAHSHGAADDLRYMDGFDFTYFDANRTRCLNEIIPWLITNSHELHLSAIHDYVGGRIWHAGRTPNIADAFTTWWRPNSGSNMGFKYAGWLHLETMEDGWGDATPIAQRALTFQPTTPPKPAPDPIEEDDMAPFVHIAIKDEPEAGQFMWIPGAGAPIPYTDTDDRDALLKAAGIEAGATISRAMFDRLR